MNILVTLEKLRAFVNHRSAVGSISGSFYVISEQRFQRQFQLWKEHLPAVHPYYAVKCNPDYNLMRWMAERKIGFDCASAREISIAKQIDMNANIIFANPCKKMDDIIHASTYNANLTVVDSREEIDKLYEAGWKGTSLLRLRVEDSKSLMPFSAKFGADFTSVEGFAQYAKLKGQKLHGISFHVGSGCEDPEQYKKAIEASNKGISILRMFGHYANIIDIGGGFTTQTFTKAAKAIRESKLTPTLDQRAFKMPVGAATDGQLNGPNYPFKLSIGLKTRLIAEPGRFFAASSHDLFVRVIGKKEAQGGKNGFRYTIDESLYGQFSCIPFDHARPKWIRVREEGEPRRRSTPAVIYGRTCDSLDYIASCEEAEELKEGDWLWFPHMGAYTTATSTEFNGFPKPPSLVIQDYDIQQLPNLKEFEESEWPSQIKYVSPVKVPAE
uniref:Orn/DAP/Arg decarboxylase 2 N-terminal domain-containing protein n=1 Tax=viral metagenome TaxID=1070528 RepID=A0A6C0KKI1_9ZZZZ